MGGPKVILLQDSDVETKFYKGIGVDGTQELKNLQQPFIDSFYNNKKENLIELQWLLTPQEDQVEKCTHCYIYNVLQNCDLWINYPKPSCVVLRNKDIICKSHNYHSTHHLSEDANSEFR